MWGWGAFMVARRSLFVILSGIVHGGDEGARTPDLDSAIVALSQLSYIPGQTRS